MKHTVALVAMAVVLCAWAAAENSTRVISVTGPNPADGQDVRLDTNSIAAVHWTSAVAYNNVTISAQLYCTPCGKTDTASADVYLVTEIGPLASVERQVALARITVSGTREFVPVFRGLTLPASTYYLVIYSPDVTQPMTGRGPAIAWGGTSEAAVTVVASAGTTRGNALIYSSNAALPAVNSRFPPASHFEWLPTTSNYDLNGAYNLQYTVTAMPSLVIPHIAAGAGWKTSFGLVNRDQVPVTYTLKFWSDTGAALPISMVQGASSLSGTVTADGMLFLETTDSAILYQGWVEVIASGRLGITTNIHRLATIGSPGEAAFTAMVPTESVAILFDNTDGTISTIALVNSNPARELTVSLVAQLADGTQEQTTVMIAPNGHLAAALSAIMPALAGTRGFLHITAPLPDLSVVALRFTPGASITTMPRL